MAPAEKLALAQRSYAAFNAGLDIDALLPLYHPDCEWRMGPTAAAFGTDAFRGHDGLRAWVAALDEGFETWAIEMMPGSPPTASCCCTITPRPDHAELRWSLQYRPGRRSGTVMASSRVLSSSTRRLRAGSKRHL